MTKCGWRYYRLISKFHPSQIGVSGTYLIRLRRYGRADSQIFLGVWSTTRVVAPLRMALPGWVPESALELPSTTSTLLLSPTVCLSARASERFRRRRHSKKWGSL